MELGSGSGSGAPIFARVPFPPEASFLTHSRSLSSLQINLIGSMSDLFLSQHRQCGIRGKIGFHQVHPVVLWQRSMADLPACWNAP